MATRQNYSRLQDTWVRNHSQRNRAYMYVRIVPQIRSATQSSVHGAMVGFSVGPINIRILLFSIE